MQKSFSVDLIFDGSLNNFALIDTIFCLHLVSTFLKNRSSFRIRLWYSEL